MKSEQVYNYRAYMLRVWREGETGPWRATLENAHTGKRYGFADLQRLFDFLTRQTGARTPGEEEVPEQNADSTPD